MISYRMHRVLYDELQLEVSTSVIVVNTGFIKNDRVKLYLSTTGEDSTF